MSVWPEVKVRPSSLTKVTMSSWLVPSALLVWTLVAISSSESS